MSTTTIRRQPFSDSSPDHDNLGAGGSQRTIHDPFCIMVWKFRVEASRVTAFSALCDEAAALVSEQPKCLFQRLTRKGGEFKVHVGLEDSYGVLAHVSSFSDTLRRAHSLGRYEGVEIHGAELELSYLREPLRAFEPVFFERAVDRLV